MDFRKLASNWTGHLVNNNRPRTERVLFEFAHQYITLDPQLNCSELNGYFLAKKPFSSRSYCINFYNVAFSVPYNSKYKDVFDRKIGQILEAGLIGKYIEIEMDKIAKTIKSVKSKAINIPLSIIHLRPPSLLLLILLGISLLVFCIECACRK